MEPNSPENQGISLPPKLEGSENKKNLTRLLSLSRFDIQRPTVEKRELLPDVPCVITTTHLSDIDVQEIAIEIAKDRTIGIASQATNLTAFKPLINLMGSESFFPISNRLEKGNQTSAFRLKADEMEALGKAVASDKRTMLIAAHRPTHDWELPDRPGLAAVIVAHEANAPLIPVALDIESETPVGLSSNIPSRVRRFFLRKRPNANIIVGEAVPLSQISAEKLKAAINLYSADERGKMSQEEQQEAQETLRILKDEAGLVMQSLAEKLPPAKRGRWGDATQSNQPQEAYINLADGD